jgi:hypothetical protein
MYQMIEGRSVKDFLMKMMRELIVSMIVHSTVHLIVHLTDHLTVHLIVLQVDIAEVGELDEVV